MRSSQNNPPPTVKRKSRKKEKKRKDEDRRLRYNAATSLYRRGYPEVAKAGATVPPAFSKKEPSFSAPGRGTAGPDTLLRTFY
jgi:hypothetical protein